MGRSVDVVTTRRTLLSIIQQVEPNFRQEAENPIEFEFSNGRTFRGREKSRGAYADD